MTLDYLPQELLARISNVADFARVLVLDKWACNADGRQAVYVRKTPRSGDTVRPSSTRATASMPANGLSLTIRYEGCTRTILYMGCDRMDAFEPALTRAEEMDADTIFRCATTFQKNGNEGDRDGLTRLVEAIYRRRSIIRRLISEVRRSSRNPFPHWRDSGRVSTCPT